MVQRIQVPAKYQEPKALVDARDAVGRVASISVPQGAQIIGTYLEDAGRTALAYEVPRGRRAVTIAVSDVTGVGGLVRPANFVDILGTFEFGRPSTGSQGERAAFTDEHTETRTLMQNVLVVAVGRDYLAERADVRPQEQAGTMGQPAAQAHGNAANERNRDVRNVTVLVTPDKVQELVLAQQIGTLTLALRSSADPENTVSLPPLDPSSLLHIQRPLKSREAPAWREIRGSTLY
jgi:pilus assembly protein CpaB